MVSFLGGFICIINEKCEQILTDLPECPLVSSYQVGFFYFSDLYCVLFLLYECERGGIILKVM
jgi:hypothetical protein